MNLILFEKDEVDRPLMKADPRCEHILKVLRRKVGDDFDVGLINGPRGKATLVAVKEGEVNLRYEWSTEQSALFPVDLIVGLSRPQTNRKILNEATTLGIRSMRFVTTERGEPSYASSKLWTSGEWRRHLVSGAEQAFATKLPEVKFGLALEEAIRDLIGARTKVALDNYESSVRFGKTGSDFESIAIAVGSERGWTRTEREMLVESGYLLADLGERVLRTETAVVAALAIAISQLG